MNRPRPRRSAIVVSVAILFALVPLAPASAQSPGETVSPIQISAPSAIVIDAADGSVLWEKGSADRRAIASTTKIITAMVVLEQTKPGEQVTASAVAESVGSSDALVTELELTKGEVLTVRQLLYGLLLISANDAAIALAEYVGRSVNGFARLMNSKAEQIGARSSHFVNPDGLDAPGHYSTAADMALIATQAMKNELFRQIVATQTYSIPRADPSKPATLNNRNQLLGAYAGINGIKTGQTMASGKSLVASAQRDGESRISVVLGSTDSFADSRILLNHAFNQFRRARIATKGKVWGQLTYGNGAVVDLVPRANLAVLVGNGQSDPLAVFDSRKKILEITNAGRTKSVRIETKCGSGRCGVPENDEGGWVVGLMSIAQPALRLLQ